MQIPIEFQLDHDFEFDYIGVVKSWYICKKCKVILSLFSHKNSFNFDYFEFSIGKNRCFDKSKFLSCKEFKIKNIIE